MACLCWADSTGRDRGPATGTQGSGSHPCRAPCLTTSDPVARPAKPPAGRYDVGVMENCKLEVDSFCADAKSKLRGNAAVLKCLVAQFGKASDVCQVRGRGLGAVASGQGRRARPGRGRGPRGRCHRLATL
jgi:hypothetical protein